MSIRKENKGYPNCAACKHYYITWDKRFPKGCKAMGFKSREMPHLVVFQSSGKECMYYEEKPKPGK